MITKIPHFWVYDQKLERTIGVVAFGLDMIGDIYTIYCGASLIIKISRYQLRHK